MLSNYPDGMDFGAYDDYQDPVVECCDRRVSNCECPECDRCGRVYSEDHEWEEISDSVVCATCYEVHQENKEEN